MSCPHCQGAEKLFDASTARGDLESYRRNGPAKTTQMLLDAIRKTAHDDHTLLEIGGGVGGIGQVDQVGGGVGKLGSGRQSIEILGIRATRVGNGVGLGTCDRREGDGGEPAHRDPASRWEGGLDQAPPARVVP